MKTHYRFFNPAVCLLTLNLLILSVSARAQYTCDIQAPSNFLTSTTAAGNVMTMTWTPFTGATGGYRLEVFSVTTSRRYYETLVPQNVTSATVSIVPGHRYIATIRSICELGTASKLSLRTQAASGGRITIDDVIFLTCNNACPGLTNSNYTNILAGNSLSWLGNIWPGAPNANNLVKRSLFLQLRKTAAPNIGISEKIRISREDLAPSLIRFNDTADICKNDGRIAFSTSLDKKSIVGKYGNLAVCTINFESPDAINFSLSAGWEMRYTTGNCLVPNQLTDDPTGDRQQGASAPTIEAEEAPATGALALACVPNPASDEVAINFELVEDEAVALEIYTPLGELVSEISERETRMAGQNSLRANISGLPTGTYFAVLRGARWQSAARFFKE